MRDEGGLAVELERPLQVRYEGAVDGTFVADMLIDNRVIIENKAVQNLAPAHEVQLVNYLTATGIEVGLLLNFGAPSLEYQRKVRSYHRSIATTNPVNPVDPVRLPLSFGRVKREQAAAQKLACHSSPPSLAVASALHGRDGLPNLRRIEDG